MAGLGAGVAVSFLACPTELMKCRLQAQASVEGKTEVLARGLGHLCPSAKCSLYKFCTPIQNTAALTFGENMV